MPKIIVSVPGGGKTYFSEHSSQRCLDLDSKVMTEKTNGWETEYVKRIEELTIKGDYDIIFVSFNRKVLEELCRKGIKFALIMPRPNDVIAKEMMIGRYCIRTPDAMENHLRWIKRQIGKYDETTDEKSIKGIVGEDTPIYYLDAEHPYISSYFPIEKEQV